MSETITWRDAHVLRVALRWINHTEPPEDCYLQQSERILKANLRRMLETASHTPPDGVEK